MPELVVDLITSLDGYASAEGWPGWWGLEGPRVMPARFSSDCRSPPWLSPASNSRWNR